MRLTFGLIVLLAAAAAAPALAQQDPKDQEQRDQQREWESRPNGPAFTPNANYLEMASDARRQAEQAKTPEEKARLLKIARNWEGLANQRTVANPYTAPY